MSPPKLHNTWAQAAGKGLNTHNNTSGSAKVNGLEAEHGSQSGSSSNSKARFDNHMTRLQISAALSDGWGQMCVNQDTSWDIPLSPQGSPKENNPVWRNSTSTGTEIWESNIRHRNKVSVSSTSNSNAQSWVHTPSTHIGGTWGEEEDVSNMWTGVPQGDNTWVGDASTGMWSGNPSPDTKHWGGQLSSTWGESDDSGPDNGTSMWSSAASKPSNFGTWSAITKKETQPSGWDEPSPPTGRRGVSNYDDGTAVWGNPMRQGKVSRWKDMPSTKPVSSSISGMPSTTVGQVGGPCIPPPPPPGPGMLRLPSVNPVINKPDACWNKPSLNRGRSWTDMPPHRDSPGPNSWDDPHLPIQTKSVPCTPSTPGSAFGNWGEPSSSVAIYWGAKPKTQTAWVDGQVDTSSWGGVAKQGGKPLTKDLIWASKQFRILTEMNFKNDDVENALRHNNMNLEDALVELQAVSARDGSALLEMDGLNPLPGNRAKLIPVTIGDDLGYAEQPLEAFPGNFYSPAGFPGPHVMQTSFGGAHGFKHQVKSSAVNSNTSSLLNNATINSQTSSLNMGNSINSLNPTLVQKILQQTQSFNPANLPQNNLGSQGGRVSQQNFPSAAQLRHLVQQIQMAVQAGHLNPQILNQPLASQTLQLLYQLLQQIKLLHQLQQQQLFQSQHMGKGGTGTSGTLSPLQLNVQITQTKQRIMNLQNQIAAQQALFLKQQQQLQPSVQHASLQVSQPSTNELFKPNLDPMPSMHTDLRDLSLKETASQANQSRLNQWKLPSLEKEETPSTNCVTSAAATSSKSSTNNSTTSEFSRAPGSVSKSSSGTNLPASHTSTNLQSSLVDSSWSGLPRLQSETWSETSSAVGSNNSSNNSNVGNLQSGSATSPVEGVSSGSISASEKKDSICASTSVSCTSNSSQTTYTLSDLVPEFEPGKPWKGTSQLKNVEDDPHVTPGSVTKSPLSLNNIKDSDLFNWNTKSSPASSDNLISSLVSLSSNTWAFTPLSTSSALQNSTTTTTAKSGTSKSSWGPLPADSGQDRWGQPVSKTRGPPPGLAGQGKKTAGAWTPLDTGHHGWSSNTSWDRQNNSNFLVLRNLTPQIDGSTLKTLCMQHGPLHLFHLFLNHGIALVRYSTGDETAKAQSALNNCVLGNTTILADIPTEAEVQQYLQLASGQLAATNMTWPQSQGSSPAAAAGFRGNNNNNSFHLGSSGSSTKLDTVAWNGTSINLPGTHLWAFPGTAGSGSSGLWGIAPPVGEHEQCSSSTLNSYLPGDLLGGESV